MSSLRHKATLIASLAILTLTACGQTPTTATRSRLGMAARNLQAPRAVPAAQSSAAEQDIGKNPFVVWIKQNHPGAAAKIINQYLSVGGAPNPNPEAERERSKFRQQVIDMVTSELMKNLVKGLPEGLAAKAAAPGRIRVSGYQQQFGFDIKLNFDFIVRIDKAGLVWITVPAERVNAYAESSIVSTFSGDLDAAAHDEVVKNLDIEGPPNARKTPGLTYLKGGTFLLDPGFAFVNMPS